MFLRAFVIQSWVRSRVSRGPDRVRDERELSLDRLKLNNFGFLLRFGFFNVEGRKR